MFSFAVSFTWPDSKPRRQDKMQPKAAHPLESRGRPFALALFAALVGVSAAIPVHADDLPDWRKPVVRPGKAATAADAPTQKARSAAAASRCALYGEGFVPVIGSEGCVKIGGRLRIDLGGSMAAPVYAGSRDGINPAAHLRIGP
jgi:hypothetical protein